VPRHDQDVPGSGESVLIERDVRIPTEDAGISLSAVVYRPDTSTRVPALVSVYPYRTDAWIHEYHRPYMEWFAQRGYASVLVDLRGTGCSDGTLRPFHDPEEADDGVAAIAWAAEQNWCTGSVGMWGLSFGGFMTMATAQRNPSALKAIMPLMNSTDPERETMHPGGARGGLQPLVQWGLQQLTYQLLPPMFGFDDPAQQVRWASRLTHEPALSDLSAHGPGHPIWEQRRLHPDLITVPAFCVGGWRDSFQLSIPQAYEQMKGPKRLLMGPWGHVIPQGSPFSAIDFRALALRWWDYWLRGIDNGVMDEDPVVVHVQGDRPEWRALPTWPPMGSARVELGSGDDATLRYDHPSEGVYEPDPRIGPYSGIQCIGASSRLVLPLDQHTDDMRSCTLTSAPFDDDVLICGLPELRFKVEDLASDQAAIERIVFRLTDVDPTGRSTMITTYLATMLPGGTSQHGRFWPTAYRVARGHRLRVVVSDSAFPWLVPLAHPRPFRLSDVSVHIPTLTEGDSVRVDVPSVDTPLSGLTFSDSDWSIAEEPNREGVRFTMWTRRDYTAPAGHRLREDSHSNAYVCRTAPHQVVYSGERSVVASMRSGETITVKARVHTNHGMMTAEARVTIDDVCAFTNQWRVPLATGPQAIGS
jgi:predicted acyl esterase